jgi:dTMP kinase
MKIPTSTTTSSSSCRRGALIVLEGVDRCGKSTQTGLLVKHLVLKLGLTAVAMRFPDRTTLVGNLIDQYLQSKSDVDDRAIHLLFSANRWELAPKLNSTLMEQNATVVCDRYAYSGVAFSSAKESLQDDLEWCRSCDVGLPAPDAVIFLDLTQEQAEQRGGYVGCNKFVHTCVFVCLLAASWIILYFQSRHVILFFLYSNRFGQERYEKKEMQQRVRERFNQLQAMDERDGQVPWYVVDAAQSIEQVQKEINDIVEKTIEKVQKGKLPLGVLWQMTDAMVNENKEN